MASSGTFTIYAESIDNGTKTYCNQGLPSSACYHLYDHSLFGRGAAKANIVLNYSINDSGLLSVSYNSTTYPTGYSWYVCADAGYHMEVDFSTDASNWTTIMSSFLNNWRCADNNLGYVANIASALAAGLTPVTLTQSGYIRARMWTATACPTCGTSDALPNAFPDDAGSVETAVPVHVDVSWTATLKYNANGGTGAPSNQTHTQTGNSYTFTVSNTVPTRTNYRFEGWATSSSASTPSYHGGDSYTINKSDPTKTLYAVWTEFYRPGATFVSADPNQWGTQSGEWYTHNRGDKAAHILATDGGSSWTEMRTIDAPTGLGDPPAIYHDSKWYNQKKIGKS